MSSEKICAVRSTVVFTVSVKVSTDNSITLREAVSKMKTKVKIDESVVSEYDLIFG